jgi:large subunit ribosomal protein L9
MEVILLEKVVNLGDLGDQVSVKPGYGRNFLISQKKAVPATRENVAQFEVRRAELEQIEQAKLAEAELRAAKVNALALTLTAKAGEEGKLFGSITIRDVVEAVETAGVAIDKSEVLMPDGPLRALGDHEVEVQLHAGVIARVKLTIIAEE